MCRSISEIDTCTCSNGGDTCKIHHEFDWNKKCLICLITCKQFFKQYVRQTVDTFRSHCNNYKDNARKYGRGQHYTQKHLYEHFDLPGQTSFLEDVTFTLVDKTDSRSPIEREDY